MTLKGLKDTDIVVIPTHNEETSIGMVVRYVMETGIHGRQLLLGDSCCTDRTIPVALGTARAFPDGDAVQVVKTSTLELYRHGSLGECGIERCSGALRQTGKGASMYAAVLALTLRNHPPDSRVFFIDGDITNPSAVDPIGHLLKAWQRRPDAHIAKLASGKRENEGVLAFINLLPFPYNRLSDLAWPLCGQQSLRLDDLKKIPFPTDYSVEVALLAALAESYGSSCFVQEPITVALKEEEHPDDLQKYTRMFTTIMLFLRSVVESGSLHNMKWPDVCRWNHGTWRHVPDVGVPRVSPDGGNRETLTIDALLPPITKLIGS